MKLDIIGQRLRRIRKLIGVSRGEIERKHNISANTIKAWEFGKAEIGVIRLVNYLNVFQDYGVFLSNASFALDNHKSWSCNRDLIDGLLSDN